MSTDDETRVSLEAFQRHFLATHLKDKDKAACVLDQIKIRADRLGQPFAGLLNELVEFCYSQKEYQDDSWYVREVPLDKCYLAHSDFRGYPATKNQRFVDFMSGKRQEIESGLFPCSWEIRAPWSSMPEPLVREREPGKYYVLDGQLRVIRYWYHGVPNVKVFIYKGIVAC